MMTIAAPFVAVPPDEFKAKKRFLKCPCAIWESPLYIYNCVVVYRGKIPKMPLSNLGIFPVHI